MNVFAFFIVTSSLAASWFRTCSAAQLTDAERKSYLDEHNKDRTEVVPSASDMVLLQWDETLADVAQEWANRCVFQHRPRTGADSGLAAYNRAGGQGVQFGLGENLAIGTGMSISKSIKLWDDEKVDYNLGSNSCKPNRVCGHYTQDVWAMTRYVGCAYKKGCSIQGLSAIYHVCNYYPPGNFNGRPPYTAGQPATACPQGTSPGTFNGKSICVEAKQSAGVDFYLTDAERKSYLDEHNEDRTEVVPSASDMVLLQWDETLADVAQEWANRCAFQHRPRKGPHSGLKAYTRAGGQALQTSLGENLAMGTGMSITKSIKGWDDEKVDYDLGSNSCKPNHVCGHYTQDVWANTRYVGCAYKKGSDCGNDASTDWAASNGHVELCQFSAAEDQSNYYYPEAFEQTNDAWNTAQPEYS
eukprot:g2964.t1